jgi:hypothetical protein
MKNILSLALMLLFSGLLIFPARATTISGVKTLAPPSTLGSQQEEEAEPEGKTTQSKDTSPVPTKPVPALPGKTVSPTLPTTKLPATKTPTGKLPAPRKPSLLKPGGQKSPLGQRPQPQLKPLLTKPGMMKPGVKGATSVAGITVGKMRGTNEAALVVRGKGLTGITSALLFLNNRPVADVTLKRGKASDSSLKISMTSRKGGLVNKGTAGPGNYELRLRAGLQEFKLFTPIGPAAARSKLSGLQPTVKTATVSGARAPGIAQQAAEEEEPAEPAAPAVPDLVITNIAQDPPNPLEGQSWRFEVSIMNQGGATAVIPQGYDVMAHNAAGSWMGISKNSAITIAPGQTYVATQYPGNAPSGSNPVTFKADPENIINEIDENNNQLTGNYTETPTQGPPDLVITNISVSSANPTIQGFNLNVTVENQGAGVVDLQGTQNALIGSINSDNILLEGMMNMLPGESRTYTCSAVRLAPGPFDWTIKVDPENRISEANENNNTMTVSGTITGDPSTSPDLAITAINQVPPNPLEGQSWRFEVSIMNQGSTNAFIPKGYDYMAHNASGSWVGITGGSNITIAPGQTFNGIQYPGNAPSGTNQVTFKVDPENALNETNEANNQLTASYTVTVPQGQADLVITDISLNTANPTVMGFSLNVTVENQGVGVVDIQGGETALLRTVGTDNIELKGVLNLTPGQSRTFTCNAVRLSPGPFNWTIKVDPDGRITEPNEANNTMSVAGTISY